MKEIFLSKRRANIVLMGFMGCGKSTYARRLARILRREIIDTDALIEREQGSSCREIIERRGEAAFRELEAALIERLAARDDLIIATGGGFAGLRGLRRLGFIVWLYLPFEATARRLAGDSKRPLFDENARALFERRLALYERECDIKIGALGLRAREFARILAAFVQLDGIAPARVLTAASKPATTGKPTAGRGLAGKPAAPGKALKREGGGGHHRRD